MTARNVPVPDDGYCGNVFCLMAASAVCTCRCQGEWHGAGRITQQVAAS